MSDDLFRSVESVKRIQLRPGDVVVVELDRRMAEEQIDGLRALVCGIWPGHRVVVCDPSIRLKVVTPSSPHVVEDVSGVHVRED